MRDLIQAELDRQTQPSLKRLCLMEFLQHLILQSMYRHGAFKHVTFTGGTALRILYHIPRFSEDLDFSLTDKEGFAFSTLFSKVQKDLALQRFDCELRLKEDKTVAQAMMKFPGVLKEFGLSPMASQKILVKCEMDSRPPKGGTKEILLVNAPISYQVTAFDLPSLFAGKLNAIFFRAYTKGRDYYDLAWYLGKRIKPNFLLLNNGIEQTQGKGHEIQEGEFVKKLTAHLERVDFAKVRAEVEQFMAIPEEIEFIALGPIKSLLRHY